VDLLESMRHRMISSRVEAIRGVLVHLCRDLLAQISVELCSFYGVYAYRTSVTRLILLCCEKRFMGFFGTSTLIIAGGSFNLRSILNDLSDIYIRAMATYQTRAQFGGKYGSYL